MSERTEQRVIRVMLVDDHDVVRSGLSVFIKVFPDLQLVGEAANGPQAIQVCAECQPDVILMDILMPVMDGIQVIRAIRAINRHVKFIALSSASEPDMIQGALQAGAIGYLTKNVTVDHLAEAIRAAAVGKTVVSPEVTQALIEAARRPAQPRYDLTERELEVLQLLCQGQNNVAIAESLTVSRSTVKFHISSILAKLGVASRTEAVALAITQQLVT